MNPLYNRYIPQSDGSYRRNRVQDVARQQPPPKPTQSKPPQQKPTPPPPCEPEKTAPCPPPKPVCRHEGGSVGGFLRQLLPKEFDTGDLIIVLLLLLMAGDCEEDRNNALLTLALYFLM